MKRFSSLLSIAEHFLQTKKTEKTRWTYCMLGLIVVLSALVRFTALPWLPQGLNRDESALAYNAFLLRQTGKDEWQHSWPLTLKSFGDYKLVGYVWAIIGSFFLFGYSDFAVRFPSALAGTVLPVVGFFFVRRVLKMPDSLCLLAALLLALLPVSVFYSRYAFEANLSLTLLLSALTLLFDMRGRISWQKDLLAAVFFLLAVFTYNTPLLLLPGIVVLLILIRGIAQPKKWLLACVCMGIVGGMGLQTFAQVASQKSAITIFSDETTKLAANEYRQQFSGLTQKIVGNKLVFWGNIMVQNLIKTFSPDFLVWRGGQHPWHQLPHFGHLSLALYLIGMGGIALGIFQAWKSRMKLAENEWLLLLGFTVLAPLPAIVTVDAPHATRSLFLFVLLVFWAILFMKHMLTTGFLAKQPRLRLGIFILLGMLWTAETFSYVSTYALQYPTQSQQILQAGYDEAVQRIAGQSARSPVAVIDPSGYQYIATAWALRMPPEAFFQTMTYHLPDRIGFQYGYKVGQFRFVVSPNDVESFESTIVYWDGERHQWVTQNK